MDVIILTYLAFELRILSETNTPGDNEFILDLYSTS